MDRNLLGGFCVCLVCVSLSARRAWIEIPSSLDDILAGVVALRKESVDRNIYKQIAQLASLKSLSARRAWIEIWHIHGFLRGLPSLSARRAWIEIPITGEAGLPLIGRSPQGERG